MVFVLVGIIGDFVREFVLFLIVKGSTFGELSSKKHIVLFHRIVQCSSVENHRKYKIFLIYEVCV